MSLDEIVEQVNSLLQVAAGSGKSLSSREIDRQYTALEGKSLLALIGRNGFSNLDEFLSSYPNDFRRVGNLWTGVTSAATQHVLDHISASRGGRKGGGSSRGNARLSRGAHRAGFGGGGGGGGIPRVDHSSSRYGSAFNSQRGSGRGVFHNNVPFGGQNSRNQRHSPPRQTGLNPMSSSRFGSSSSREQFGGNRSPPRRRTPSPPPRRRTPSPQFRQRSPSPPRSYRSNDNDNYRRDYDRDEDRRRPPPRFDDDDRNVEFGRYQAEAPRRYPEEPSRQRPGFGRQNDYEDDEFYPNSSTNSRDRERDRDEYSRPTTQTSFDSRRRDDFEDDSYQRSERGMSQSRSSRSLHEDVPIFPRTRSKSRSMREMRTPQSEEETLASRFEDTPMTNERANEILIESGVKNISIKSTDYVPRNTKQNAAVCIVEIFEDNQISSLKVEELISFLNQRQVDLPIKKYGDIGSLKRLKEAKPRTLKCMQINEDTRVISYLSDSDIEEDIPRNRRPDSELAVGVASLHEQLEMMVPHSITMKQAIDRLVFNTNSNQEKIQQVALAILQQSPQVFNLDRLDDQGTIIRIKAIEVTANGDPFLSDDITSPALFQAYQSHPWTLSGQFDRVPREFGIEVVKFTSFQTHFFVKHLEQNQRFEQMQTKIQTLAEAHHRKHQKTPIEAKEWRKGDACLVYCKVTSNEDESEKEWHRAIFEKYDEEDDLLVLYLIDVGHKKSAIRENVIPMPTSMSNIDPFAIRCSLPDFSVTDEDEYEDIENHWKSTFDSKTTPVELLAETIKCGKPTQGLIVRLKVLNKSGRYFDILGSMGKCISLY